MFCTRDEFLNPVAGLIRRRPTLLPEPMWLIALIAGNRRSIELIHLIKAAENERTSSYIYILQIDCQEVDLILNEF